MEELPSQMDGAGKKDARASLISYIAGKGTPHPIWEFMSHSRRILLEMGFSEMENPMILSDTDLQRIHGELSFAAFDRTFYLSGLTRPDIDLQLGSRSKDLTDEERSALVSVLKAFRVGELEGEELPREIAKRLHITYQQALEIVHSVPQLRVLTPYYTGAVLRSGMIQAWIVALKTLGQKVELPLKLFSQGPIFRREAREDLHHLRAHYVCSMAVIDRKLDRGVMADMTGEILERLELSDFEFKPRAEGLPPYTAGVMDILASGVKTGVCGIVAPEIREDYGIERQMYCIELGVERFLMARDGYTDIRKLVHPQLHGAWELSDKDIASALHIKRKPVTEEGQEIARRVVEVCEMHGETPTPCEVPVWEGEIMGTHLNITMRERAEGSKLCGPAALNELVVKNGSLFGIPSRELDSEEWKDSVSTNLRYIDGFSSLAAARIEGNVHRLKSSVKISVRLVKSLEDINMELDDDAMRFILSRGKTLDVRGPMYITLVVYTDTEEEDVVEL